MERKHKVGRNDPCPCGSGKKYKHCCGALADTIHLDKALGAIHFNAKIGYVGTLGRKRDAFCRQYTQHKKKLLQSMSNRQIQEMQSIGKTISCHKGCSYCCDEIFSISVQEAEAIAYYLCQHDNALQVFLQNFPKWLAQAARHQDIFMRRQQATMKGFSGQINMTAMADALAKEASSYWRLNIHCPFLSNNECPIYEVRPWACAALFSTTPTEWCSPSSPHHPSLYLAKPALLDLPFWDNRIAGEYLANMPDTVYRILTGGIRFLSELPGLDKLYQEFLADSEVIRFFLSSYR